MRILVHGLNYAPEPIGVGYFTGEMVRWLCRWGHQVQVVSAPPYYPFWKRSPGYGPFSYASEKDGDVGVVRCPLYVPGRRSGLRRIAHLMSFAFSSLPVVLWQGFFFRPDLVVVVAPTLFSCPAGLMAAGLSRLRGASGVPWLHIQDFEVEAAFGLGLLSGGVLKRSALALERGLLKAFRTVSTITLAMQRRLHEKGLDEKDSFLFPNWIDAQEIFPLDGANLATAQKQIRQQIQGYIQRQGKGPGPGDGALIALYSGNLGEKQGIEVLLEAARLLGPPSSSSPGIVVILCGDGALAAHLEDISNEIPNLFLIPLQPRETFNDLLNFADIHLLPQRSDAADLVMPSKLGAMLASGRPVVVAARPETALARAVKGCGRIVPPDDAAAMAAAINELAGDAKMRKNLGELARKTALENWGREKILCRLEAAMLALAGHEG